MYGELIKELYDDLFQVSRQSTRTYLQKSNIVRKHGFSRQQYGALVKFHRKQTTVLEAVPARHPCASGASLDSHLYITTAFH